MVLEAYWESAAAAEERALSKKQEKAISRWKKLIKGIQIRSRLQEQYGDDPSFKAPQPRARMTQEESEEDAASGNGGFVPEDEEAVGAGGFLAEGSPAGAGGFLSDDNDGDAAPTAGRFMADDDEEEVKPVAREADQQRPQTRLRLNMSAKLAPIEDVDSSSGEEDAFKPTAAATRGKRKRPAPATRTTTRSTKRVKAEKPAPVAATAESPTGTRRRSTRSHAKTEAAIRRSLKDQEEEQETEDEEVE